MGDDTQRKIGEIDANVRTLLQRTERFDDRLSAVEKKVWWAAGVASVIAFVGSHIPSFFR